MEEGKEIISPILTDEMAANTRAEALHKGANTPISSTEAPGVAGFAATMTKTHEGQSPTPGIADMFHRLLNRVISHTSGPLEPTIK